MRGAAVGVLTCEAPSLALKELNIMKRLIASFAVVGLIAWGVFRLGSRLFRGSDSRSPTNEVRSLPTVDHHYEAAMRELDRELGHVR